MTDQELIAPKLPKQKDPADSSNESGWYKVANSEDIGSLKAIQIDNFPTQIVVWRGEDASLRGLDLYCKHMGASLACGEVNENSIQCPFHAWRWAGDGKCDQIPYAKKIPVKAVTRSWEVIEDNGAVYVWFDKEQKSADPKGKKFN